MEKMRPSTKAWASIGIGVLAYDLFCPQGEQLSERYDEWMDDPRKRILAMGAAALVATHLCNKIPERYDPIHWVASVRRHNASTSTEAN